MNLFLVFGEWTEKITNSIDNSPQNYYTNIEEPNTEYYGRTNVIFTPVLLIRIYRNRHPRIPDTELYDDLSDSYSSGNQENIKTSNRIARSASSILPLQSEDVDSEDDLALAESSIPFHPLFAIRHRKEVKRREYARRGRRI